MYYYLTNILIFKLVEMNTDLVELLYELILLIKIAVDLL